MPAQEDPESAAQKRARSNVLATPTSCSIPRHSWSLSRWTGCAVSLLLRVLSLHPAPWRSRCHPEALAKRLLATGPAGAGAGTVGAGRARLPRVEETQPCGHGCQGRSFTQETGRPPAALPAHWQLSFPPLAAAALHPARGRTEEKGGRLEPAGGRLRAGAGWSWPRC